MIINCKRPILPSILTKLSIYKIMSNFQFLQQGFLSKSIYSFISHLNMTWFTLFSQVSHKSDELKGKSQKQWLEVFGDFRPYFKTKPNESGGMHYVEIRKE